VRDVGEELVLLALQGALRRHVVQREHRAELRTVLRHDGRGAAQRDHLGAICATNAQLGVDDRFAAQRRPD
jgi:hypothetical protein